MSNDQDKQQMSTPPCPPQSVSLLGAGAVLYLSNGVGGQWSYTRGKQEMSTFARPRPGIIGIGMPVVLSLLPCMMSTPPLPHVMI